MVSVARVRLVCVLSNQHSCWFDSSSDTISKRGQMPQHYQREVSVLIAILALSIVLAILAPGFFTLQNQSDLLLANMPVLIVAIGMTLVVLAAQIDISVGSVFAICSVASGVLAKMGFPTALAGIAACALGAV